MRDDLDAALAGRVVDRRQVAGEQATPEGRQQLGDAAADAAEAEDPDGALAQQARP